jgi:hypothetical protein
MGGGGFLGLGPAKSAPPPPDYAGAAQQTAQGNLDAARAASAANRVNQYTPYGSLEYTQSGTDQYGNPTWSATTNLSPEQQQLFNIQNQTSLGLGNLQNQGLDYVRNMISTPFDTSNLPQTGYNAGQTYYDAAMQRLQPQIAQSREKLNQDLANQGIALGSKAYDRAQMNQAQRENDLLAANTTSGFQAGLQANRQGFEQAGYIRNEPINTLNAIRSGSQVTNPTFSNSIPMQATTTGVDALSAAQMGYNAQMGDFNSKQAQQANFNAGLMGLAGAGIMAKSDIRVKENIKSLGYEYKGLPVYEFEYKTEFKAEAGYGKFVGVMAQDVEKVMPYAVITGSDGYKMVNYGAI